MQNIKDIKECYGCGVCAIACPTKIITIKLNEQGFYEPNIINNNKCINCGRCLKVCSFIHEEVSELPPFTIKSFAGWSKNDNIRELSSSGGIAYEIANTLIQQDYIACGVKYNVNRNRAEHFLADQIDDFLQSIGSKYIPSYTYNAFNKFIKGNKYLVIGTPCQIDSLRRYIRLMKIEDNFILIDFFCHGTPSMKMWNKYLEYMRIENAESISWRSKQNGWHDSWVMNFEFKTNKISSSKSKGDLFYKFFLKNRCLNLPCYKNCKYKSTFSAADLRIGDLWGNTYKQEEKGVSGIFVFSEKGLKVLNDSSSINLIPHNLNVIMEAQMKKCPPFPSSYKFVRKGLQSNKSLESIDRTASLIEFLLDFIPYCFSYYLPKIINLIIHHGNKNNNMSRRI